MVGDSTIAAGGPRRRGWLTPAVPPQCWALWRLRPTRVLFLLVVEALAVVATVVSTIHHPPGLALVPPFAILLTGMLVSAELTRPAEQRRAATALGSGADTPWVFAGMLVLRPAFAMALVVISALHQWFRVRRRPGYRQVFGAAATAVAGHVAAAFLVATRVRPLGETLDARAVALITVAGLVFLAVNAVLVTAADGPGETTETWPGHAFDAAMTASGVALAWAVTTAPFLVPLLAGATVVLHRGGLVRGRPEHVAVDPGTGVLTAESWRVAAEARRSRRGPGHAVLVLDLDHFRQLNDRYGARVGDAVLRAVADALRDEVRADDLVGRSGGEEFVVLLPGTGRFDALAIAERIRLRIASTLVALKASGDGPQFVGVTVSVGVASTPGDGVLDDALVAAEAAVLRAKAAGRNRTLSAEP